MPQAPDALRALFANDGEAWEVLRENFTDTSGVIRPKPGHAPTVAECAAIDYLVLEWDYAWEPDVDCSHVSHHFHEGACIYCLAPEPAFCAADGACSCRKFMADPETCKRRNEP